MKKNEMLGPGDRSIESIEPTMNYEAQAVALNPDVLCTYDPKCRKPCQELHVVKGGDDSDSNIEDKVASDPDKKPKVVITPFSELSGNGQIKATFPETYGIRPRARGFWEAKGDSKLFRQVDDFDTGQYLNTVACDINMPLRIPSITYKNTSDMPRYTSKAGREVYKDIGPYPSRRRENAAKESKKGQYVALKQEELDKILAGYFPPTSDPVKKENPIVPKKRGFRGLF